MVANVKKTPPVKKANKRGHNLAVDGAATRWKEGQSGNPLGKPLIKSNSVYWENKYAGFTEDEILKEINKPNLTLVQIAAVKHWMQLIEDPTKGHMVWQRWKELCERDQPKDTPAQMPDISITIIREG